MEHPYQHIIALSMMALKKWTLSRLTTISILRWIVGLGQIDIGYEASVMASHAA